MVATSQMLDAEPTPEFKRTCIDLQQSWTQGKMPAQEVLAAFERLQQETKQTQHRGNQAYAEWMLGFMHGSLGNLSSSIRHYERSRRLFELVNNRRRLAALDLNQGENYRNKGDYNRARYLYQMAYETARETDFLAIQTIAISNQGLILLSVGKFTEARKAFEEGYALAMQWTDPEDIEDRPRLLVEIHHALATIELAHDRLKEAWQHAYSAISIAHECQFPLEMARANSIVGEVITALHTCPEPNMSSNPNDYFAAAVTLYVDMNAEVDLGRTLLAHGKSLAKQGKRNTAIRKMQQALLIFTKLGMSADAAAAADAQRAVMS